MTKTLQWLSTLYTSHIILNNYKYSSSSKHTIIAVKFGLHFRSACLIYLSLSNTHTYTHLMVLCLGLPVSAGTRKVKPIWILLKQQTVSGSGISWAICKSAHSSRQTTTPAPHHSVFYRLDALHATQPMASKHCQWSQKSNNITLTN